MITGEAVNHSLLVNVSDGRCNNFEDELIKFQNKKSTDKKDMETFM